MHESGPGAEYKRIEQLTQVEVVSQALLSELRSYSEELIRGLVYANDYAAELVPVTVDEELAATRSRQLFEQHLREHARELLRLKVRQWLLECSSHRAGGGPQYYISHKDQHSLEAHYLSDEVLDEIVGDAILWVRADAAAAKH